MEFLELNKFHYKDKLQILYGQILRNYKDGINPKEDEVGLLEKMLFNSLIV